MLISEIYVSRQGEGQLTGQPSVFVRTSGCNLRCDFCDTPFTSWRPKGSDQSLDEMMATILSHKEKHVVITGGEPMLQKSISELTERLHDADLHITIETAGTIHQPVRCDLMSISPKMSNSTPTIDRAGEWRAKHEQTRLQPNLVTRLISEFEYQLKFVVASENDVDEIQQYLESVHEFDPKKVMLMPEGTEMSVLDSRAEWVQSKCDEFGFSFCPRMHIQWYGNKRGT